MKREHELTVQLKERFGTPVFSKTYRIALWDDFVKNPNPKEHGFKAHTESYIAELWMNNNLTSTKYEVKKRDVVTAKFPLGVGTEIAGSRPAIVVGVNEGGHDLTVIPLTSITGSKLKDAKDKLIVKDETNKLFADSYARLRQIRTISNARVIQRLGAITDDEIKMSIITGLSVVE